MTTYIYARVSTIEQNSEQQAQYLANRYIHDFIVEEKFSGTTTERPKFQSLLKKVRKGDTLIVKEVSRIGRKTSEVLEVAEQLKSKGVHLVVDQLGGVDVTSSAGEMILTVMAALAKMERDVLLERQRIGIDRAKSEGAYKGRKAIDDSVISTAKELIARGMKKSAVAKQLRIGESTLYKYLALD
ncbi:MAG: recombinase family protein [Agarilytica sp.]